MKLRRKKVGKTPTSKMTSLGIDVEISKDFISADAGSGGSDPSLKSLYFNAIISAEGLLSISLVATCRWFSSHTSSPSRNVTQSPVAAARPALRAAPSPPFGWCIMRSVRFLESRDFWEAAYSSRSLPVESVEPSSTHIRKIWFLKSRR